MAEHHGPELDGEGEIEVYNAILDQLRRITDTKRVIAILTRAVCFVEYSEGKARRVKKRGER